MGDSVSGTWLKNSADGQVTDDDVVADQSCSSLFEVGKWGCHIDAAGSSCTFDDETEKNLTRKINESFLEFTITIHGNLGTELEKSWQPIRGHISDMIHHFDGSRQTQRTKNNRVFMNDFDSSIVVK